VSRATSLRDPAFLLATWFGAGLLPKAPGTWGSLAALPFAWIIASLGGPWALGLATVVVSLVGWWAAERVVRQTGIDDPGLIVIDEVAGQWLVLLLCPPNLWLYAAGFALFRLFDITKPWPAGWADRSVGGGLGVMLDDLLAAIYGLAILGVIQILWGV
jgi:phosphatidylglycerophosphatase A